MARSPRAAQLPLFDDAERATAGACAPVTPAGVAHSDAEAAALLPRGVRLGTSCTLARWPRHARYGASAGRACVVRSMLGRGLPYDAARELAGGAPA